MLLHSAPAAAAAAKSLQSCPTRCDPIDGSPLSAAHRTNFTEEGACAGGSEKWAQRPLWLAQGL